VGGSSGKFEQWHEAFGRTTQTQDHRRPGYTVQAFPASSTATGLPDRGQSIRKEARALFKAKVQAIPDDHRRNRIHRRGRPQNVHDFSISSGPNSEHQGQQDLECYLAPAPPAVLAACMAQKPSVPAVTAQDHPLHHSSGRQPSPQRSPSTWHAQAPDAPHFREAPEEAQDEEAQIQEADEAHKKLEAQIGQELEFLTPDLPLNLPRHWHILICWRSHAVTPRSSYGLLGIWLARTERGVE
jgi:hypothetical protein